MASTARAEPPTPSLYDDPVVYDVLHTPGAAEELDGVERLARLVRPGSTQGVWLEPACGTGRLLRLIAKRASRRRGSAERGEPATPIAYGFDRSRVMVDDARSRLERLGLASLARVFVAEMRRFVAPTRCPAGVIDVALNTINTFRHLMTDDEALAHLRQVRRALAPEGVYIVGMSTTVYGWEPPSEDVWEGARGPLRVRQVVQYEPADETTRAERVTSHVTVSTPSGDRHDDCRYELRGYSSEQWTELIEQAGFELAGVADAWGHPCEPAPLSYRLYALRPAGRARLSPRARRPTS